MVSIFRNFFATAVLNDFPYHIVRVNIGNRGGNLRLNSRLIPGELAMIKSALNSWLNYFKIWRHIEVAGCEKTVMPDV